MADGDLNRREVLEGAGVVGLGLLAACNSEVDDSGIDTAQDRYQELVDAVLAEDLDALLDLTEDEFVALRADPDLSAVVFNFEHILYTAQWWGRFKRSARQAGQAFVLPQGVRENLRWTPTQPKFEPNLHG